MKVQTIKQFKEGCNFFDENISKTLPNDRFKLRCEKCKSFNTQILYNRHLISQGSEYTGIWTSQDFNLVFKCCDCGNAISIKDEWGN